MSNDSSSSSSRIETVRKKLVIVGDSGCGKTCLLSVFGRGKFLDDTEYVPTIFDNDGLTCVEVRTYESCFKIGPCLRLGSLESFVNVELNTWDTGGSEDLDRVRRLSYPDADVVLICYAVDDPTSFRNVSDKWVPEVRHFCGKVPIVLVGTKHDLRGSRDTLRRLKKLKLYAIGHEEIDKMAKTVGAFARIECSAKTGEDVREVFDAAARAALGVKKSKPKCKLYPLF